jgi:hypothetical protein
MEGRRNPSPRPRSSSRKLQQPLYDTLSAAIIKGSLELEEHHAFFNWRNCGGSAKVNTITSSPLMVLMS